MGLPHGELSEKIDAVIETAPSATAPMEPAVTTSEPGAPPLPAGSPPAAAPAVAKTADKPPAATFSLDEVEKFIAPPAPAAAAAAAPPADPVAELRTQVDDLRRQLDEARRALVQAPAPPAPAGISIDEQVKAIETEITEELKSADYDLKDPMVKRFIRSQVEIARDRLERKQGEQVRSRELQEAYSQQLDARTTTALAAHGELVESFKAAFPQDFERRVRGLIYADMWASDPKERRTPEAAAKDLAFMIDTVAVKRLARIVADLRKKAQASAAEPAPAGAPARAPEPKARPLRSMSDAHARADRLYDKLEAQGA